MISLSKLLIPSKPNEGWRSPCLRLIDPEQTIYKVPLWKLIPAPMFNSMGKEDLVFGMVIRVS